MTTDVRDTTGWSLRQPRGHPGKSGTCRGTALLSDARVRLALGVAGLLATALPAHADHVGGCERRAFRAVNGLPDSLYVPAWTVMQLGTLGAAPAAAGVAWLAGDRRLAWRLAIGGPATWALSKVVKQKVRRPRPAGLLAGTRRRGRDASGLGYLSGHAGVATAMATAAGGRLGPRGRAIAIGLAPVVGLSRAYVGAHLPLDIAGGAALGLAVDAATELLQRAVLDRPRPGSPAHSRVAKVTSWDSCARRT